MTLGAERVAELIRTFPAARTTAVENFIASLDGSSFADAFANLRRDASAYRWNMQTVLVIRLAILEYFR